MRRRSLLLFAGFFLLGLATVLVLFGGLPADERVAAPAEGGVLNGVPRLSRGTPELLDVGPAERLEVGSPAPPFTLRDLEGNEVSLVDFRGRPVIINFWATWCAPCQLEMPELEAAYQERQDEGLVILAINREEDAATVREFFYGELDLSFTPLLDEEARVNGIYRVFNLPSTYFVDENGIIRATHRGLLTAGLINDYLAETMQQTPEES